MTADNRRLEAIRITGKESFYLYRVHQKSIGWSEWGNNGEWRYDRKRTADGSTGD